MKHAVIALSGSQHLVKENDIIVVSRLSKKEGDEFNLNALLLQDEDKVVVGQPELPNVQVLVKVIAHTRGKKTRVATYKAKSRYRRVKGFKSSLSKVQVLAITSTTKKPTNV